MVTQIGWLSVAFSPDGTRIASGSEDRWIKVAKERNDERNGGKSDRNKDHVLKKSLG